MCAYVIVLRTCAVSVRGAAVHKSSDSTDCRFVNPYERKERHDIGATTALRDATHTTHDNIRTYAHCAQPIARRGCVGARNLLEQVHH